MLQAVSSRTNRRTFGYNQRWRLEPLHPRHSEVHPLRIAGKPARRRLGPNNIKSVYVDEPRGLVYIGAHAGGLSILHRNSGRMENFNQLNSPLINENVYAILPDGENNFLLGTLSALVHFNPENGVLPPSLRKMTERQSTSRRLLPCSEIPKSVSG